MFIVLNTTEALHSFRSAMPMCNRRTRNAFIFLEIRCSGHRDFICVGSCDFVDRSPP